MIEHILFDFFGTLVLYSPSRTEQGYELFHRMLREAGARLDYAGFLDLWCEVSDEFEEKSLRSRREFSMNELGNEFLRRALGKTPDKHLECGFVDAYLSEWNKGVRYIPGIREFLDRLSKRYTLAIITNTSDSNLISRHLYDMGTHHTFREVVTSVEYGFRKPHSGIFHHTMQRIGARPDKSVYVGDSFEADYQGSSLAGMHSLLIDPDRRSPVPEKARLEALFDLEERLGTLQQSAAGHDGFRP